MIDVTTRPPLRSARFERRPDLEARVLIAARDCVAAAGLRATTVDDIASAAGCSRASIYRVFPGGRRGLLRAMVSAEVTDLLHLLAADVDAAPDLSAAVSGAVHTAAVMLAAHPALQRLLDHEPGAVMPYISFDGAARSWPPSPPGVGFISCDSSRPRRPRPWGSGPLGWCCRT